MEQSWHAALGYCATCLRMRFLAFSCASSGFNGGGRIEQDDLLLLLDFLYADARRRAISSLVLFSVWASVLCPYLCSCVYPHASRDAYNCRSTRTANYRRQLREAGAAMTTHSHLDATTKTWNIRRDVPLAFILHY